MDKKTLNFAVKQLATDNIHMRIAGNNLAMAALKVIAEYDGTHRLAIAVGEWVNVIAKEGGRGGTMKGEVGDWIIQGVNGEYYPCKDDIFQKTYEEVE